MDEFMQRHENRFIARQPEYFLNKEDAVRPIRVHLADSDHFSRAGISAVLASASDITIEKISDSMHEAVQNAVSLTPHIVILEYSLSGADIHHAIEEITSQAPSSRVVLLANSYGRAELGKAYDAGSSGLISKNSISAELPSALRMVAAGYQLFAQPSDGWEKPMRYAKRSQNQSIVSDLSDRDKQLMRGVASGMTNVQISRSSHISEGSVKLHLARIMDELEVSNRVQLAVIASETGLITSADLRTA
ncbi:response regulator transcription factor [Glutamicibacter arilaitensis]|uniref:response regulator transcription factor n=1 Tax=Glutamicibacter arilaitensis TaxID=256701 RepID=UPI00384B62C3